MGIPDQLACLLRHLFVGQEATIRIGCGSQNMRNKSKNKQMGPNEA